MSKTPSYKIIDKKNLEKSEIEISLEIAEADLSGHRTAVIEKLKKNAEIPGFRKGHAPEKMIIERVGEIGLLQEAAEDAIEMLLPDILEKEVRNPLGMPRISFTKLALGNPVGIKLTIAILPEVTLPDYKKLAKTENEKKEEVIVVTDKDVEDTIHRIQHMMEHDHGGEKKEGMHEHGPIDDAFVKKLGDFKDVADFRIKLTENIRQEKMAKAKDKKRVAIAEAIIAKTKTDVPGVLIESELGKMESQFTEDITRMGVKIEDYLKHIKKTMTDLRKEWTPDAEKRAMLQLVLGAIAEKEKIVPDEKEVSAEVEHMIKHYPTADPFRARAYVESLLKNEKVLAFLEEQK